MTDKTKIVACLGLLLFFFCYLSPGAKAYYGPKAYVTEYVTQDYWWNGTAKAAAVRKGYVQVSIPNSWDVLQYVRVNLSSTTDTDLFNTTAYANTVTSYPTVNSTAYIYVNLTGSIQAQSYNLTNATTAPTINLSLSYVNYFGGTDIWDGDNIWPSGSTNANNTLQFNISIRNPSTSKTLAGVVFKLLFNLSAGPGGRGAVNITLGTNVTTGGGSTYVTDRDADGDYDTINWTGTLNPSTLVYIVFNATLTEGQNIFNGDNSINLDGTMDKGGMGNFSEANTLTGRTVNYKISRGPIRQGVDLQISGNTWYARGLIMNMANGSLTDGGNSLTYNVTDWRMYEVIPGTGSPYTNANLSAKFNASGTASYLIPSDGMIYTTDSARSSYPSWYNTTNTAKPYVASYFDWYVCWSDSSPDNYYGQINTTMDMQTLYKVDQADTKALTGVIYPDTGGQTLTVNDTAIYMGSSSISVGNLTIWSIIPVNTSTNAYHGRFEVTAGTIYVYFYNTSGGCQTGCQLKGDTNVNWSYTNPTPYGQNGTIRVSIGDLSSARNVSNNNLIGVNLSQSGDRIVLVYSVTSNVSMTTGDFYRFTGNTTFKTTSGTPEAELHQSQDIQVSSKRLLGYKDLFNADPTNPTRINATLIVSVNSSAGEYISGIKFIDYVVNGTFNNNVTLYVGNLTVRFYNNTWNTWTNGTSYRVTFNGTRQLTDGTWVEVFEFTNATGTIGFNMTNNEIIEIKYQMNVGTSGSYILPLQIAAFDPSTGESFSAESWGVIRVDVPVTAVPLQITDHELELAKRVAVGIPATWIKNFEVYNPNPRPIQSSFSTTVFGDAMQGFVGYYNERGERIEDPVAFGEVSNGKKDMQWGSTLNAFETRTYEVRVLTPPVVEIDRDIEVLDKLENKMVKLKMDVFLKSFAEEKYSNIILNLPIGYENILEVKDGFGRPMQFTGSRDSTSIIVDEIEPAGMKTITVIYKASYPTIIITPDRDRYDLESPVSLEILVINGGETIDYPYVEVEIYTPGMDVIYSNLEKLKTLEPLEKTQTYEKFIVPMNAPGGMYIASAKFREDFTVLASTTGNFFVVGTGATTSQTLQIIIVLSVTLVLVYFSFKKLREVRRNKSMLEDAFWDAR